MDPTEIRTLSLGAAYFDYDRAEIRTDMREVLKRNAGRLLVAGPGAATTIEGYTDERGSEEYNLALGQRRAEAVRKYLTELGVPASQLRVISYGESRPAAPSHDESAWKLDRRVSFIVSPAIGMGGKPPVSAVCLKHCVDPKPADELCFKFDPSLEGLCDSHLSQSPGQ